MDSCRNKENRNREVKEIHKSVSDYKCGGCVVDILQDVRKELVSIKGDWQNNSRHSIIIDDFSIDCETEENRLNILKDTQERRKK